MSNYAFKNLFMDLSFWCFCENHFNHPKYIFSFRIFSMFCCGLYVAFCKLSLYLTEKLFENIRVYLGANECRETPALAAGRKKRECVVAFSHYALR
jgi:hypothetical protein